MTPRLLRRLTAACGLATALLALPASAAYSGLYVFGDSLSDNGNVALVAGTDPFQVITGNSYIPSLPYASGTFSDGAVWADGLASALGLTAAPSLAGGTNYAFGGARTRDETPGGSPSLLSQVNSFLGAVSSAPSDGLYVLAGGGNNARSALEAIAGGAPLVQTLAATALKYAADVGNMVDQLQAAGAVDIVVWNAPNLGLAPAVLSAGSSASFLGSLVSDVMNRALMRRLEGETGVQVFDLYGLLGSVVADPGTYGMVDAANACGAVLGCDPTTSLFWDGIHPTSGGHALLAQSMFALVAEVPEPGMVWLFAAGLGVLVLRRRRA